MCLSSGRPFVCAVLYGKFFMMKLNKRLYCNFSLKNIPYKTACTNGLTDDEHTILETRRRHEEFN
jgi:hypothetical protein